MRLLYYALFPITQIQTLETSDSLDDLRAYVAVHLGSVTSIVEPNKSTSCCS